MAAQGCKDTLTLTPEEIAALSEAFQEDSLGVIAAKLQTTLHFLENVRLNIAIVGEADSGKSSFINSIRGLGNEDPGSARAGRAKKTSEPVPYPHPKYPNVIIWELPDLGNPFLQIDKYVEKFIRRRRYDCFIVVASERFTITHVQLARAMQSQGKHFYFVRSSVYLDMAALLQRRCSTVSEKGMLTEIREKCRSYLQDEGMTKPKVFLLSLFELDKFDFSMLCDTIARDLDDYKCHAFLVALPNISQIILEKKATSMLKQVWLVATVACTINAEAVPEIPGVACDLELLGHSLTNYRRSFGLELSLLDRMIERTGGSSWTMGKEVGKKQVIDLLRQARKDTIKNFACQLEALPVLRILASCSLSFATVYQMLREYLDGAAKDAQSMLTQAKDW